MRGLLGDGVGREGGGGEFGICEVNLESIAAY